MSYDCFENTWMGNERPVVWLLWSTSEALRIPICALLSPHPSPPTPSTHTHTPLLPWCLFSFCVSLIDFSRFCTVSFLRLENFHAWVGYLRLLALNLRYWPDSCLVWSLLCIRNIKLVCFCCFSGCVFFCCGICWCILYIFSLSFWRFGLYVSLADKKRTLYGRMFLKSVAINFAVFIRPEHLHIQRAPFFFFFLLFPRPPPHPPACQCAALHLIAWKCPYKPCVCLSPLLSFLWDIAQSLCDILSYIAVVNFSHWPSTWFASHFLPFSLIGCVT